MANLNVAWLGAYLLPADNGESPAISTRDTLLH